MACSEPAAHRLLDRFSMRSLAVAAMAPTLLVSISVAATVGLGATPAFADGTPPGRTTAPSISSSTNDARVGATLTASPGIWSGDPAPTLTYQWQECADTPFVENYADVGTYPLGLDMDVAGNLYVSNFSSGNVSKVPPSAPPRTSTLLGNVDSPNDVILDAAGNIYTVSYLLNRVSKTLPNGDPAGSPWPVTVGNGPNSLAIDTSGNLYVTNKDDDTVSKILPDGTVSLFGTTGDEPHVMAFDSLGNLYIANESDGTVSKLLTDGTSAPGWPKEVGGPGHQLYGIAVDAADNVYLSRANRVEISKITAVGEVTVDWARLRFTQSDFSNKANKLAIDAAGNLYGTDFDEDRVYRITPAGVASIYGSTTPAGGDYPTGIFVDALGDVYTANSDSNNVTRFYRCTDITAATAVTYELTAGDLGKMLRVKVTATNASGSAQNASAEVGPVFGECVDGVGYTEASAFACFVPDGVTSLDVLVVGGGGGGGFGDENSGGGGGGGEVRVCTLSVTPGQALTGEIGAGGAAATTAGAVDGGDGGDSSVGTCVSDGGLGGRGTLAPYLTLPAPGPGSGGTSGNGNGGGIYGRVRTVNPAEGVYLSIVDSSGGGGGAAEAGDSGAVCDAGNGGDGQVVNLLDDPGLFANVTTAYGGGGGGGLNDQCEDNPVLGTGGAGGGGDGAGAVVLVGGLPKPTREAGKNAAANSGGGGGGGGRSRAGGSGAAGYVELRFPDNVTTTQVSDTSISLGDTVSDTATITTTPDATIGDPTGSVQWYYCYSSTTPPASCSASSGTVIGSPIAVVDDTPNDGVVTATLSNWLPPDGLGFYLFHAVYSGDSNYYPSADDGTNESFEVTSGGNPLHVCVDKLYVTYGAQYYSPKVYYCVPEPTCVAAPSSNNEVPVSTDPECCATGPVLPGDPECEDLGEPELSSPLDGYSTMAGDMVVASGQVGELSDPLAADEPDAALPTPRPLHYEHGVPPGYRKVSPSAYPDTVPPVCTTDYEPGTDVTDPLDPDTWLDITCTGGDAGEYEFDYSFVDGLRVYPAVLTVKPKHLRLPYDSPEPSPYEFTVKGFKLGETALTAEDFVAPSCDSDYERGDDAGSKFDITCDHGDARNYTFRYRSSHVHVEKLRVPVKAADRTVTYGDPAPDYGFALSGLRAPDSVFGLERLKGFVAPVCSSSYTPVTAAGSLAITCAGGSSTNYEFVPEAGTLTVLRAPLRVVPRNGSVSYGSASAQVGFDLVGFVNGESAPGAGYTAPRCTGIGYTSRTAAGSVFSVVCAGGVSRNYQLDHSATSTVTVNKATLTVTPKALSIRKGSAAPGYTFTVAGFANGQTATTAASYVAPRCTSTYTRTSPVGSYTITCAGGSAANYSFAYRTATLTVR